MKFNKIKIWGLLLMIVCSFFLSACNIISSESGGEISYSRENVEAMCSNFNFGGGRLDDTYVAMNYIYNNKELAEKYGDSFEADTEGCVSSAQTFFFLWLYKGSGICRVFINGDEWRVEVEKRYFGKWEVTKCYQNTDYHADSSDAAQDDTSSMN